MSMTLRAPRSGGCARYRLALTLTHACPLRCGYCYAGRAQAIAMPVEIARAAVERGVASVASGGRLDLVLLGGEPLVALDVAREAVAHARRSAGDRIDVVVHLTTSGAVPLRGPVLRFLRDEEVQLGLSIDGLPEVHDAQRPRADGGGSSTGALAALDAALEAGLSLRIVSVVRPETVDRLVEGLRFLADRGARAFDPSIDWSAPWDAPSARDLIGAVTDAGTLFADRFPELQIGWIDTPLALRQGAISAEALACGYGRGEMAVAPSGRLYPCERLVGEDRPGREARRSIGRLDDADGPFGAPADAGPRRPAGDDHGCSSCSLLDGCSRSCACANLARTGDADEPDGLICAFEEARLRAAAAVAIRLRRQSAATAV